MAFCMPLSTKSEACSLVARDKLLCFCDKLVTVLIMQDPKSLLGGNNKAAVDMDHYYQDALTNWPTHPSCVMS